ncbi:MAG: cation:proton antiporter [Candidatus Moranbacteria bacterium]|nr:cation:proton antiporter [Candidatus Moranbacteria bacterium]
MHLAFSALLIVALSAILTLLSKKTSISSVVFLIIAGLVIGLPDIKPIIIGNNVEIIEKIGNAALIALMFLAGLESSWRELYQERRDAFVIAFAATVFPFIVGFSVFSLLGFKAVTAAVMGISMSIAAEATKARVLIELKKLKTKVGAALMGAGIIDDLIGLSAFMIIAFWFGNFNPLEDILIIAAILAFLIGLFVHKLLGRGKRFIKMIEIPLVWLVIPFFFISLGLNFNLSSLALNPSIVLLIVILAPAATIAGTLLSKPLTDLRWRQLYLVGWGMNSRGAIGLALALVAFKGGLITDQLYSGLVVMALAATMAFPFVIRKLIKNNPKIMN